MVGWVVRDEMTVLRFTVIKSRDNCQARQSFLRLVSRVTAITFDKTSHHGRPQDIVSSDSLHFRFLAEAHPCFSLAV